MPASQRLTERYSQLGNALTGMRTSVVDRALKGAPLIWDSRLHTSQEVMARTRLQAYSHGGAASMLIEALLVRAKSGGGGVEMQRLIEEVLPHQILGTAVRPVHATYDVSARRIRALYPDPRQPGRFAIVAVPLPLELQSTRRTGIACQHAVFDQAPPDRSHHQQQWRGPLGWLKAWMSGATEVARVKRVLAVYQHGLRELRKAA